MLYVLDEPSIGLHQRDNARLLETLKRLRDLGNTVIVVEHDEDAIRTADHVLDIGPGAGIHGGHAADHLVRDRRDRKVVIIVLALFPILSISAMQAVRGVGRRKVQAAMALGASRTMIFRRVIFPASLPGIFTSIRVSIGIGVTMLVGAEMIATSRASPTWRCRRPISC